MELERVVRVSLALPIHDKNLLLIRREKPPFKGLLALPGGKVEDIDYDYYEALKREMMEELGTKESPSSSGGILYEKIISEGKAEYFAMHIFVLYLEKYEDAKNVERIPINEFLNKKEDIIPSDYRIIENILRGNRNGVYQAVTISLNGTNIVTEWNDITSLEYRV